MYEVFGRGGWVKVEKGPPLIFRLFHVSCGPDVRKQPPPQSEIAGKGSKSLPMSQLPCSLEAVTVRGALWSPASLQNITSVKPSCQLLLLEEEGHAPCAVHTSSERVARDSGNAAPAIPNTNNLVI